MSADAAPDGQDNETVQQTSETVAEPSAAASASEPTVEPELPPEEPEPEPDAEPEPEEVEQPEEPGEIEAEQLFIVDNAATADEEVRAQVRALIEAVVYITDEPLSAQQIATALQQPQEFVQSVLDELVYDYARPDRGLTVREVAGGYKMGTKPEHHEAIRTFVRNLKPPLKLSLPALETLAVIAYKQPVTAPEIMDIRGVQGVGVLKTLLDRKLIATAGRRNVVGKPILYKTTREFLVQFGLKDLSELPTLKEFEELGRLALTDAEPEQPAPPEPEEAPEETPEEPRPEEPAPPEPEPEQPAPNTLPEPD